MFKNVERVFKLSRFYEYNLKMQYQSSSSQIEESKNKNMSSEDSISDSWKGTCISDILHDGNPWKYYTPPINPSKNHTVLFELPVTLSSPPKPHFSSTSTCHWNNNHVKMPFSPKNLYPVKNGDDETVKPRWEIIQCSLLRTISSSKELEEAILSYNSRRSKFHALHYFFEEVLTEDEAEHFFNNLLPKIIQLALQLPELIPTPIPLLKQGKSHSISLSQLQISCILANAFLCTFRDIPEYPGVNFNRLFECDVDSENSVIEKIKCLMHYFRRVCNKTPVGVVTFERKYLQKSKLPRWDKSQSDISNTKLHISSTGTIEDDGLGLLQVDFANCMVGGGVLGWGCVQEEIRFVICPELLVSRLFTEKLGPTEALLMIGVERFSKYKGYANSFEWAGNYEDETPFDISGRKRTSIVAIDALYYSRSSVQFCPSKMIRELNKAYVGYFEDPSVTKTSIPAVATGNWGCGAFNGKIELKALLQMMACTVAGRNIVYYTFGDVKILNSINNMHNFLVSNKVKVSQLWQYLCRFNESNLSPKNLFSFIQQAHLDYLKETQKDISITTKKSIDKQILCYNTGSKKEDKDNNKDNSFNMDIDTDDIEAMPKSISTSKEKPKETCIFISETRKKKHFNKLKSFLYSSDEEESEPEIKEQTILQTIDNFNKIDKEEINIQENYSNETSDEKMEISLCEIDSNEQITQVSNPNNTPIKEKKIMNKKISDYFKKIQKQ